MRGFYFITDCSLSLAGNISDVKNAVAAKVAAVQYRFKEAETKQIFKEALELRALCNSVPFIINDRIDIALAVNADGVHLGQDDFPLLSARKLLGKKKIIGITAHNLKEAKEAERLGADYLGVSPIFPTQTKPDAGLAAGLGLIREIKKEIKLPLVAIGGINLANAEKVIRAGADSLCAISAVVAKPGVKEEIEKFQKLFLKAKASDARNPDPAIRGK